MLAPAGRTTADCERESFGAPAPPAPSPASAPRSRSLCARRGSVARLKVKTDDEPAGRSTATSEAGLPSSWTKDQGAARVRPPSSSRSVDSGEMSAAAVLAVTLLDDKPKPKPRVRADEAPGTGWVDDEGRKLVRSSLGAREVKDALLTGKEPSSDERADDEGAADDSRLAAPTPHPGPSLLTAPSFPKRLLFSTPPAGVEGKLAPGRGRLRPLVLLLLSSREACSCWRVSSLSVAFPREWALLGSARELCWPAKTGGGQAERTTEPDLGSGQLERRTMPSSSCGWGVGPGAGALACGGWSVRLLALMTSSASSSSLSEEDESSSPSVGRLLL